MEEDGKYILFNAENQIVLIINATGRFILEKCNGITVGQIVKEIDNAYNVPEGAYLLGVVKVFPVTLIDVKLVKFKEAERRMKPVLKRIYIYLTDHCNLSCIHCRQTVPLNGKGEYMNLSFEECKNFLDGAISSGLKSIIFSRGEPLLNPEFHKFAEYFYKNSIYMNLETNGIFRKQCLGGCRTEALWKYENFFAASPRFQEYYYSGNFPKKN